MAILSLVFGISIKDCVFYFSDVEQEGMQSQECHDDVNAFQRNLDIIHEIVKQVVQKKRGQKSDSINKMSNTHDSNFLKRTLILLILMG